MNGDEPDYRLLLDLVSDGMLLFTASGEILDSNSQAREALGLSGQIPAEFRLPDLISSLETGWEPLVARLLEQGSLREEIRISRDLRAEGSIPTDISTFEASFVALGDTDERFGVVLRPSGELHNPEVPERMESGRYRLALRYTSEVVVVLDPEGEILHQSPEVEEVLGYRAGELVSKSAFDYIHPEDLERMKRGMAEILEAPERQFSEEFRLRHVDGSWRHFEGLATNGIDDPEVGGIVVSYRDVTERKQIEKSLRSSLDVLLALREAGQTLGSTLQSEEISTRLLEIMKRISGLTTAVVSVPDENQELRVWRAIGFEDLWQRARYTPEVQRTLYSVLESGKRRTFRLEPPETGHSPIVGVCLPLRRRSRVLGVLEIYGPDSLYEGDTLGILESLTGQAASALENARLYRELSEREQRLQELVEQLLRTQEEERHRVAYEVHDGLAQTAAAAHQHLQAFARFHPPESPEGQELLKNSVELAHRTVGEARQVIADLRPTSLDDFGLNTALQLEVEKLASEGWNINYEGILGEEQRLPMSVETGLFRIAQEALNNVRKHANSSRVRVSLERAGDRVRLAVRDWGRGFDAGTLSSSGPGERVGISSMQQRVSILGGRLDIESSPRTGTSILVEVPLPGRDEYSTRDPGQEANE